MKVTHIVFVLAILCIFSCTSEPKKATPSTPKTSTKVLTNPNKKSDKSDTVLKLKIGSNDAMKFNKTELRAKAGQTVILTMIHSGKMSKDMMGHNWVLLKQGTDIAKFAEKAFNAKATDYIPQDDSVIAHTKLIGGGEKTVITFKAPEKGTYDYICSFPGHYGMMKGKFVVE